MTDQSTVFAKKGAWKQEIGTKGWEILSFYFPDEFLCQLFKEYRVIPAIKIVARFSRRCVHRYKSERFDPCIFLQFSAIF